MRKYRNSKGHLITPDPIEYFWDNVEKNGPNGCWNWNGNMFTTTGYGQFKNKKINAGQPINASRAAWILFKDSTIGRWDFICHKCDNRRCVNYEEHLFHGDGVDNMQDASIKGRINHGEDRPQSKLTENNVREARRLRAEGMAWRPLAARYGVALNCIVSAVTGKTWSHVT